MKELVRSRQDREDKGSSATDRRTWRKEENDQLTGESELYGCRPGNLYLVTIKPWL